MGEKKKVMVTYKMVTKMNLSSIEAVGVEIKKNKRVFFYVQINTNY